MESSATRADLAGMAEQTLAAMGYELVDIEYGPRGLLRVFIDAPAGIRIEDCEAVSRQLSHLFAVEDIDYGRLEVSSPGLDRPLRRPQDFNRFQGQRVTIRLREAFMGRKNFEGVLTVEPEGAFGLELVEADSSSPAVARTRGRPARTKPAPRSPSRGTGAAARASSGEPARKLVFRLEEIERARLVPWVKF